MYKYLRDIQKKYMRDIKSVKTKKFRFELDIYSRLAQYAQICHLCKKQLHPGSAISSEGSTNAHIGEVSDSAEEQALTGKKPLQVLQLSIPSIFNMLYSLLDRVQLAKALHMTLDGLTKYRA